MPETQSRFKRWYDKPENKVKHAKRVKSWADRNKGKRCEYAQQWRKAHPLENAWRIYNGRSKKFGWPFTLHKDHFIDLITDNCFYCTAAPNPLNGIDRVDNSGGYTEDNVVTACRMCNQAKHTHNRSDFETWALRLGNNTQKWIVA